MPDSNGKPYKFMVSHEIFHVASVSIPAKRKASFVDEPSGVEFHIYSTDYLEKSLENGFRVVVVSSRQKAMDTDQWWVNLLPPEDVHFMPESKDKAAFTLFCLETAKKYGFSWPTDESNTEAGGNAFWRDGLDYINDTEANVVHVGMRGVVVSAAETPAKEEMSEDERAWVNAVTAAANPKPKVPDWLKEMAALGKEE